MTLPIFSTKTKIIIVLTGLAGSFVAGRYTAQKSTIHTVETTQVDTRQNQVNDTNTQETITTTKTPDGTIKTVEQIAQVADTKTNTYTDSITHVDTTAASPKTNTINISALIANDFSHGLGITPTYGIAAHKEILGPVTVGAFALTNGTVGISIGFDF